RRRLALTHPGVRLQQQMQRLDDLAQRLAAAARTGLQREHLRLAHGTARLMQRSPDRRVREQRAHHQDLQARLGHAMLSGAARAQHRFDLARRALHAVSPLATLARGFAIVTRADGALLTDAAAVASGEEIEARLARGSLTARVTGRKAGS
ncbi:MAG: exodeoxyribonuclease VII large subunit, partial [Steroidobacteraceae bacterium]